MRENLPKGVKARRKRGELGCNNTESVEEVLLILKYMPTQTSKTANRKRKAERMTLEGSREAAGKLYLLCSVSSDIFPTKIIDAPLREANANG